MTLLEADDRLGGHTSTVAHTRADGTVVYAATNRGLWKHSATSKSRPGMAPW